MAFSGVILLSGSAVAMNVGTVVADKRDPYPTLIAGGMVIVALAFVSEWRTDLATALAACFFLGTLLLRGEPFFTWLSNLVSAK